MATPLRRTDSTGEAARMAAVRRYDILDTPPDGAFDRITALAARLCRVPISTITIVDEDRIWFKSAVGLDGVAQIDREPGLCASAVVHADPYVVLDASVDPRTLSNSLVCGDLGLRFYVGIPLRTSEGFNLGTLNIIDLEPRAISDDEVATLADLAAIVVDELELRLAARRTLDLEAQRAASQFRDTIVAGLSHEMRTPIAVLEGISDLTLGSAIDDEAAADVQRVLRRQVHHLGRLIEQFLTFTGLEHDGAPAVELVPTDLHDLLPEVIAVHDDRAPVSLDIADGTPPVVVDPARTRQIVSELIANAVRFSDADDPVAVRAFLAGDDRVRITVEDRGPGIDQEAVEHVFEKSFRSPASTGSGLGLYVARALATAQGATIEVDSVEGEGSSFTLVVPAASPDELR